MGRQGLASKYEGLQGYWVLSVTLCGIWSHRFIPLHWTEVMRSDESDLLAFPPEGHVLVWNIVFFWHQGVAVRNKGLETVTSWAWEAVLCLMMLYLVMFSMVVNEYNNFLFKKLLFSELRHLKLGIYWPTQPVPEWKETEEQGIQGWQTHSPPGWVSQSPVYPEECQEDLQHETKWFLFNLGEKKKPRCNYGPPQALDEVLPF